MSNFALSVFHVCRHPAEGRLSSRATPKATDRNPQTNEKSTKLIFAVAAVAAIGITTATVMADPNQGDGDISLPEGYSRLVFADEFDTDGAPDPSKWNFENGYLRNGEMQYYTPSNATCRDGILVIERAPTV